MKRLLFLFVALSFFLTSFVVYAEAEFNYTLLKDRRKTIKLPIYDISTKKLILNQARLVLGKLYVHRELKIKQFGRKVDPLPKLDLLEKKLELISEEEFHQSLIDIFLSQRDLHTLYYLPMPYGCYRNLMPFSLSEINKGPGSKIIVSSLIDIPEFLELLPEKLDIEIGDELISYNGKSLRKLLNEIGPLVGGANKEAMRKIFLDELSFKVQTVSLMPKNNEVDVVFKKKNGQLYRATIPWINRGRLSCIKKYEQVVGRSEIQKEFNELYLQNDDFNETDEPLVSWKIIDTELGDFAILKLSSFEPENLSIARIVNLVESLLKNELANTNGLIIDVRNNPGGQIPLGERLIQLFGPKKNMNEPLMFHFNINPSNYKLLNFIFTEPEIHESYIEAEKLGQKYSIPYFITQKEAMNKKEQAYSKPVTVFTNAHCYSTCDMFAAQMQDHGYAVIAGEDKTTGAGGANVLTLEIIFDYISEDPTGEFVKLPDYIDMGFAWRQTIRRDGQLIENRGVKSDYVVPTSFNDVINNSVDQYRIITRKMIKK